MKYIKLFIIYLIRFVLHIFYFVPVKKNRIYLSADKGSAIRCNPLYIYRYIKKDYPGQFQFIWEYSGKIKEADCRQVKPGSFASVFQQMVSGILISNDGFGSYLPKRKGQLFINTWHGGGAYKKSGIDFVTDQHPVDLRINYICGSQTDIFISSSKKFSEVMAKAKLVPRRRFLECGMPRNDILIIRQYEKIAAKVKKHFAIEQKQKIILYAPTYRGEEVNATFVSELDIKKCRTALQQRFGGEWTVLVRKHHFVKKDDIDGEINASGYNDMQELLCAADVFITDYSSTIWDYSLTGKPGFLFVPDFDTYTVERSFYTEPETWAFPLARDNDELVRLITSFDENKNMEKINQHHNLLGIRETGKAAEIVSGKIVAWVKGEGC